MPRTKPHKYGYDWRTKNRRAQKRATIELTDCLSGNPAEAFAKIAQVIEEAGLVEATLDNNVRYGSYGDRDRDVVEACGWRDATAEEIAEAEARIVEHRLRVEQAEADQIAQAEALLRQTRPELFQD